MAGDIVEATVAHAAAFNGDIDTLRSLGKLDPAQLRVKTDDGETPAHHAAAAGICVSLQCLGTIDASLLLETDSEAWCECLLCR